MAQNRELEEFLVEANQVRDMSLSEGWSIIQRDCLKNIDVAKQVMISMDKNDPKFDSMKLQALACTMLLQIVEDYETNRKKAEELFMKSNLQEDFVIADVDNHSPLIERQA